MTITLAPAPSAAADLPRWFLSIPTWIRADGPRSNGTLSLIEQEIAPGFASPWHVHHGEDESFLVLAGTVEVRVADASVTLRPGGYAFGPHGIPHGFRVTGTTPARLLLMTSGPAFADFIRATSEPESAEPPAPREPDIAALVAAAERFGLAILGPMPEAAAA